MKYLAQVTHYASSARLDPYLVMAMIEKESGYNPWAYNPEPRYGYLWDVHRQEPFRRLTQAESYSERPPDDFRSPRGAARDAEWWGQQASWGLLQMMGAVARERGFTGTFLPALCNIQTSLSLGTEYLRMLIDTYGEVGGVAAYNAGPGGRRGDVGQAYAADVLHRQEGLSGSSDTITPVAV